MTLTYSEMGRLGGRPARLTFDQITEARNQSPETVKNKRKKRGIKARSGTPDIGAMVLRRLVSLEFLERIPS